MNLSSPVLLVIMGITGDLSKRKLLPSIEAILKSGVLSDKFQIVGITRQKDVSVQDICSNVKDKAFTESLIKVFSMDTEDLRAYEELKTFLFTVEKEFGVPAQRLFYMSMPPQGVPPIIEKLGISGLAKIPQTKLLLEKPFGVDFSSAQNLIEHAHKYFSPEQIYRIDHYLAKQMAQNLMVFREYNSLFRRTWNRDFIERIEILVSETIGIEGRAHFYEQTGALRDVVQSHLLQLVALTLMAPTSPKDMKKVPERRAAILKDLEVVTSSVSRGQYLGYREEVNNTSSLVETYVAMTLISRSPQWEGVPIQISTGKMLSKKSTEIRIYYKKDQDMEANELVLRLQPNEGVALSIWSQRPGYEGEIENKTLNFTYSDHYSILPDAYEKVLVDVMRSDHDLFVSSEEILESWRILKTLQETWTQSNGGDLFFYQPGEDVSVRANLTN